MKNVFLTVDLEEWYDLDYLKKYTLDIDSWQAIPKIFDFLDILDSEGIKATFFILASVLDKNADIVRDISSRGHEIACHGLNHELLYNKSNDLFYKEILEAKIKIEGIIGREIYGYRASCFSMDRDKLDLVKKAGYSYDSSKISFKQHPLYRDLDMKGFKKIEDLVYRKGDFFEFEIPTLAIGKYNIPISGGGYLRLMPLWMIFMLVKKYEQKNENFLLYLHPFELTSEVIPIPKNVSFTDRFRLKIGRNNNVKNLKSLLLLIKNRGGQFMTLRDYKNDQKFFLDSSSFSLHNNSEL